MYELSFAIRSNGRELGKAYVHFSLEESTEMFIFAKRLIDEGYIVEISNTKETPMI